MFYLQFAVKLCLFVLLKNSTLLITKPLFCGHFAGTLSRGVSLCIWICHVATRGKHFMGFTNYRIEYNVLAFLKYKGSRHINRQQFPSQGMSRLYIRQQCIYEWKVINRTYQYYMRASLNIVIWVSPSAVHIILSITAIVQTSNWVSVLMK